MMIMEQLMRTNENNDNSLESLVYLKRPKAIQVNVNVSQFEVIVCNHRLTIDWDLVFNM